MTLTINDEKAVYPDGMTVKQLLEQLGLSGRPVAVERNRDIVFFRTFAETVLHDGDTLEVVSLAQGG